MLNVSYNRLTQFPDDWVLLYRLVELNVAGNDLRRLPKDVQKLRNLASLDVSDNLIDQLPDKLAKMAALRYLNIADNVIMQWPANFVKLQAKVEVGLHCNKVSADPRRPGLRYSVDLRIQTHVEPVPLNMENSPQIILGYTVGGIGVAVASFVA